MTHRHAGLRLPAISYWFREDHLLSLQMLQSRAAEGRKLKLGWLCFVLLWLQSR